jgi:hypothetical protein
VSSTLRRSAFDFPQTGLAPLFERSRRWPFFALGHFYHCLSSAREVFHAAVSSRMIKLSFQRSSAGLMAAQNIE